jgi:putative membrane protein
MNFISTIPLADTWGMHDGDFGGGWMVVMMLFWVAVIFGIVWLVRAGFDGRREDKSETPSDILERRFAEGSISVDEYRARREVLGNGGPASRDQFGVLHARATSASRKAPLSGQGRQR